MTDNNHIIEPPPKDIGHQPLFRVIYTIDVAAAGKAKAAETAWQMMRAEDAFDPVLVVLDSRGNKATFDLSDRMQFNKVTSGFVIQKYRRDSEGRFNCVEQEFFAGDDVRFENTKGEPVEPPEHEYQPFNMLLLSRDEIIDRLVELRGSIDTGGEQSRQFACEIDMLDSLLKDLGYSRK